MEQSSSWEANRFAASQEIFRIWWNQKVYYHIHKYPPEAYSLTVSKHDTFLRWGIVSISSNPKAGELHFVGCPRLLIQYIRSYPPYWRSFLRPQPEDVPCWVTSTHLTTDSSIIPFRKPQELKIPLSSWLACWVKLGFLVIFQRAVMLYEICSVEQLSLGAVVRNGGFRSSIF
jgi:hypothetical protein